MQSSAIQFVINMEIERDKNAAEKKPSYILCYWLACLSASLLTCTYMLMPVARVCVCVYVLSVPFQYSPDKSGLYTQSILDLRMDLFLCRKLQLLSLAQSTMLPVKQVPTYTPAYIYTYICMYICMYAVPTLGTLM